MVWKAVLRSVARRLAPEGTRRRRWVHHLRSWLAPRPAPMPVEPWDRDDLAKFLAPFGLTLPSADDADPQRRLLAWLLADNRFAKLARPRLADDGPVVAELNALGDPALREAFAKRPRLEAIHRFDAEPSIPVAFPLALTPVQMGIFVYWLCRHSGFPEVTPEGLVWFLLERDDDPSRGIYATYLRQPGWQSAVPDAFSEAGWRRLLAWVKRTYGIRAGWIDEARRPVASEPTAGPGVNVLAHFRYPSGLQVAANNTVAALQSAGLAVSARDVPSSAVFDLPGRESLLGLHPFPVTISQLTAEPLGSECFARGGLAMRAGVHRIGYWYWELEEVPASWKRHASWLHEIWAPTRFIGDALRRTMPLPVVDMLAGMRMPPEIDVPRSRFGLRDDRFLFLFVFDMCSTFERKNPLAVVEAYRRAFRPDEATLAIKVSRAQHDPDGFRQLQSACAKAGAALIDAVLPHDDLFGLIRCCDAYVSLHRSEGYGLTMAEAMALGKPVVATGYSGNLDFMSPENSLLVRYERKPLAKTVHVYRQGSMWAEPDVVHAAEMMRRLYDRPGEARALGERARRDIRETLSIEAAGRRMAARIAELTAKPARRAA